MITLSGRDIWRSGEKVGWIEDRYLYSRDNAAKVGYVSDNDIHNYEGDKIGWVDGDYLYAADGRKWRLEDIRNHIEGGSYQNILYGAIWLLFGE